MLKSLTQPETLAVISATAVQLVFFLRWFYRRVRNDELMRLFVADMAMNHLPHIYDILKRICDGWGIESPAAPPIRWIDLNGKLK